jgi:putative membrane protein
VTVGETLATFNASMNGASALCLFAARFAIARKDTAGHKRLMLTALAFSGLFLAGYLTRVALTGTHRYPAHDWTRAAYLAVLGSHTLLAASVPFFVGRALQLALGGRFAEHKRIVRFAFPIWAYVSVTGVVVYLMLYHLGPARAS